MNYKIYAYTRNNREATNIEYNIEINESILSIIGCIKDNAVLSKQININIEKLKNNIRYEILLPDLGFWYHDFCINFDTDYNIGNNSIFYETNRLKRMMGSLLSVRLCKVDDNNLFINSDIQMKSNTIKFSQSTEIVNIEDEIIKITKNNIASENYKKNYIDDEARINLISNLSSRASISYLDIQTDLLLKIISLLLDNSSDDVKNKLTEQIPNYKELLNALETYSIFNYKTNEEALRTINLRKKDARLKQQEYYDTIRKS